MHATTVVELRAARTGSGGGVLKGMSRKEVAQGIVDLGGGQSYPDSGTSGLSKAWYIDDTNKASEAIATPLTMYIGEQLGAASDGF
ncbi:hypothetical protein GUJ93_ZPchr0004g38106 [Zizania palustris]|uniref:Uncharacterized protein n=1 Tax=Zizania palustris TaxID=103762 RepID=A0A8J5VZ45_ZIZPA|nr:hypothetical protein GUJ93_ZPchr0004g38106 [Zizania palustris]